MLYTITLSGLDGCGDGLYILRRMVGVKLNRFLDLRRQVPSGSISDCFIEHDCLIRFIVALVMDGGGCFRHDA